MSNILKLLNMAVKKQCCVAVRYDGHQQMIVIEPHVIYTDKLENIVIDCYQQYRDTRKNGKKGEWHTLEWRKIKSAFLLGTQFKARLDEGFTPQSEDYHNGLIAIINIGGFAWSGPSQAMWSKVGATIDGLLSDTQLDLHKQ